MRRCFLPSLLLSLLFGCYSPEPPQGLSCSVSNGCPGRQVCAVDGRCYDPSNLPGGSGDAGLPDADLSCAESDKEWSLFQKLVRQGALAADNFGSSIAVDGDLLAIGWDRDSTNGSSSGSVVVYGFAGERWQESQVIRPDDGDTTDYFGSSVAVGGNTVVVGAELDEAQGSLAGSAYSFENQGTLAQRQKLLASDADPSGLIFGANVAIEGELLVVAASGSVSDGSAIFVYAKSGTTWTQSARLAPIDIGDTTAIYFGSAIDLEGSRLIVSAPGDEIGGLRFSGSAFILDRSGASFTRSAKLTPSVPKVDTYFGDAAAVSGGTAVVGVPRDDNAKGNNAGAVYIFEEMSPGNWSQTDAIISDEGELDGAFGEAVAIEGDWIAIGAPNHDTANGDDAGVVYLYHRNGGSWSKVETLFDPQGAPNNHFGNHLVLKNDQLITTAPFDDSAADNAGAAYVYHLSCPGL